MKLINLACLFLVITLLSGCAMTVADFHASPVLNPESEFKSLSVTVSGAVPEHYEIPPKNGIMGAEMKGWRSTLEREFESSLSDFYVISDSSSHEIVIDRADIEFLQEDTTSAVVSSYNGSVNSVLVPIVRTQIKYRAKLIVDGEVIRTVADRANAKTTFQRRYDVTHGVASATETMIEQVVDKLL